MRLSRRTLPIAEPCDASWQDMRSDGARRFCEHCEEHVHDISVMSEPEARSLLRSSAGRKVCLRYRSDAEGRIRFAVSPPLGAAIVVATALLLAACAGWDAEDPLSLPNADLCRDEVGYVMTCHGGRDTIPDEDPMDRRAVEHGGASEDHVDGQTGVCMGAVLPDRVAQPGPIHAPVPDIEGAEVLRARDRGSVQEAPSATGEVTMHVEAFSRSGMRPARKARRRRGP